MFRCLSRPARPRIAEELDKAYFKWDTPIQGSEVELSSGFRRSGEWSGDVSCGEKLHQLCHELVQTTPPQENVSSLCELATQLKSAV